VTTESEKTYEMLWDCRYCGTKKLLGKTHRHCLECGGAKDATLQCARTPCTKIQNRLSDQCRHKAEEWGVARAETAQGNIHQGARLWPTLNPTRSGHCVGGERLGWREERLLVRVRDEGASEQRCAAPKSWLEGAKFADTRPMKQLLIGKLLQCTSLGQ